MSGKPGGSGSAGGVAASLRRARDFPDADWKLLLPICTFCRLFMLMAEIGRDRGSGNQPHLFALWGGMPTTAMLRHRDSPFDETTLAKLHAGFQP